MSWLDNAINFISPKWGAQREAWRQYGNDLRGYDAGGHGRANINWHAINESAEYTDRYDRGTVRARARDMERNSDIYNSLLSAFKRNVYGKGYTLQAKTSKEKLNDELERLWKRWCKKQNCDVTGTQSLSQILRMCVQRKKVDGGILIVKAYTDQGFIPFQLQLFEVDELYDGAFFQNTPDSKVVGGIEYNRYNRPVAYYIKQYDIDGIPLDPVKIPAKDVIFYTSKKRPSQIREMSDSAPMLSRIRDTNEFITSVSVKQRVEACLSVFIKKLQPTTTYGRSTGEIKGKKSYDGKTITPGMIRELNVGEEVQVVNPSGQATDASSFTKLLNRIIAAGSGLSYEAVARDLSQVNYSSVRQGSIEDEMTYEEEIELLVEVMDEIYDTFVISCVLAGLVKIPKFWDKKDEYLSHIWVKAPKRWIDPQKEASANKIAIATGQKTFKQIAGEQGRDWKEHLDEIIETVDYANEKGFDLGGILYGIQKQEDPADETEPDEGNESDQGETDTDTSDGDK